MSFAAEEFKSAVKDPLTSEINELKKKLTDNPDSLVFVQLADAYRKQGNLEEAFSVCKKGLEKHPASASARVVLSRIRHQQGKVQEAALELKKVLELDPENLLAHSLLGSIFLEKSDFQAAIEEYQKILALNPDDEEAQSSLKKAIERAADEQRQGKPPSAPSAHPGKKSLSKESTATLTMAELYLKQGHLEEAVEVYQELLASDSQNLMLRQKLAEIMERRQKEVSEKSQTIKMGKEESLSVISSQGSATNDDQLQEPARQSKVKKEDDSKFSNEDILQVMRRGGKDDVVLEEWKSAPVPTKPDGALFAKTVITKIPETKVPDSGKSSGSPRLQLEQLEGLKGILAELSSVSGIMRCFLTGKDGIIVVSMGETSNNAGLGQQALAIFQSTYRSVSQLSQGKLQQVLVTAETGHILLVSFVDYVLVVLANGSINLGLLRLSLDSAAKKLDKFFTRPK